MKNPKITTVFHSKDDDIDGQDLSTYIYADDLIYIQISIPNSEIVGWTVLDLDTAESLGEHLLNLVKQASELNNGNR